jgi:exonuclease SbcC
MKQKLEEEKKGSRIEQELSDLTDMIDSLTKEISEKEKAKERIAYLTDMVNWLDTDFISLMSTMERHVMISIQKEFDSLFQNWFSIVMGDDLTVRIDEQLAPIIEQNNYETEYTNLSGGEKTAVALAYRVALNNIINTLIETIKTKDLLILDEPTDGFSSEQLDRIRDVINELKLKQVIIVSHEPKIDSFVDNVIRLHKEEHVSRIIE